jgi:hypothetical protein
MRVFAPEGMSVPPPQRPPRYLPARALPAHAYVPGRSPTPRPAAERDPSAGSPESPGLGDDVPGDWRRQPAYLWGLDLYNHGYPWEAHEAWESLWVHAPRGSVVRDMLQALIQCAAAVVHARAGRATGQARLAGRALGRLAAVRARAGSRCLGIDIDELARAMRAYGPSGRAEGWPLIALAPEASLPEPARGAGDVSE